MAFGIRELAKRLAHIRLKMNVQHVFLLAKAHDVTLIANTREIAKWLLTRDQPYKV
jgi:NAD+ kinase